MTASAARARGGLLDRLRQETRRDHEAIEAALSWQLAITSRDRYRLLLERLYGFHAALEDALRGSVDPVVLGPRLKTPLLARDLAAFGLPETALQALPRAPVTLGEGQEDKPAAYGALYVVEGASLGGQIIARHYSAALGIDAATGLAYYTGYGRETGAMWRAFRAHAEASIDPADHERTIVSARRTFAAMSDWMRGAAPQP